MTVLGLWQHCWLLIPSCPNPSLVFFWVLNKPQQGLEGQSQLLPITARVTPHLPDEVFPAVRKKTWFYQYIQETWRRNSKGHTDKEMDWYSLTFVVLLLYPTPTRDCLCASSQLSASSRELKITETGLCYVWRVPTTRMPWSDTDHQEPLDKPDFPCVLPQFVLSHWPFISMGCFGWEQLCPSSVTVPENNTAGFPNHSGTVTVWFRRMCLNSTANKHCNTKSTDMQQPGSKTHHIHNYPRAEQQLRDRSSTAVNWRTGW